MQNIFIHEVLLPELHYDVEIDNIAMVGLGYDDATCLAFSRAKAGDQVIEYYESSGRYVVWQDSHWLETAKLVKEQLAIAEANWKEKYGND